MSHESQYSHVSANDLVPFYDEDNRRWHCGKVISLTYPNILLAPVSQDGDLVEYYDIDHVIDEARKINDQTIFGTHVILLLRLVFTNHLKNRD